MSRIRGRGNEKTEVRLARLLREAGIKGWRR
ncbi:MAG: very short patch repair endonuclease, partial [Proteobacteria bacterium]|nr:very short patch repair endonuclease [Pseudomonadota bacterium]